VPVYLFYSMFGFQRVGDLAWALGDMRGRGILAGCTAGRTTLMGEGLQHDDGQSPLLASTNPAALVYDASFAYEVAAIMEEAVTDMLGATPQDRFWYLTLYNETYPMPALPPGDEGVAVRRGIIEGIYRFSAAPTVEGAPVLRASLCFSGPMWRVAAEAQRLLAERYGVAADTWAVTSWTNLRTDALGAERWNRLHPEATPRTATVTAALGEGPDPVVAITDYMRSVPDQVARFVARPYLSLGTDGFGRSDARDALRSYFEVDAAHLVVAVLELLARAGRVAPSVVAGAIADFGIDDEGAPLLGALPQRPRVQAAGDGHRARVRLGRHRLRSATSASRVSSIWPQCWKSSSSRWSRTAPLRSV
jgi:pyruvate dehydrogenase E1 component